MVREVTGSTYAKSAASKGRGQVHSWLLCGAGSYARAAHQQSPHLLACGSAEGLG
jgi:hypothetical protein